MTTSTYHRRIWDTSCVLNTMRCTSCELQYVDSWDNSQLPRNQQEFENGRALVDDELCLKPLYGRVNAPGPTFIKPDQFDPWIKDQLRYALLSTILSLHLTNFVSRGRACPSHVTQNLVTVGEKLLPGEGFYLILDPSIKLIWFDKSGAWG